MTFYTKNLSSDQYFLWILEFVLKEFQQIFFNAIRQIREKIRHYLYAKIVCICLPNISTSRLIKGFWFSFVNVWCWLLNKLWCINICVWDKVCDDQHCQTGVVWEHRGDGREIMLSVLFLQLSCPAYQCHTVTAWPTLDLSQYCPAEDVEC